MDFGNSSSTRLFLGVFLVEVTRPIGGRLLCRRPGLPAAAATVDDVPAADFRRGILEGDKCSWSGSVAECIDERRRFGGIVDGENTSTGYNQNNAALLWWR